MTNELLPPRHELTLRGEEPEEPEVDPAIRISPDWARQPPTEPGTYLMRLPPVPDALDGQPRICIAYVYGSDWQAGRDKRARLHAFIPLVTTAREDGFVYWPLGVILRQWRSVMWARIHIDDRERWERR